MARRLKLTPELQAKVFQATRAGATDPMVCEFVGISLASFYEWQALGREGKKPYSEFLEGLTSARAECGVLDLATISKAARGTRVTYPDVLIEHPDGRLEKRPGRIEEKPGDWRAAAWRLERRYPKDFGAVINNRHQNDDGTGPFRLDIDLKGVPIEELRKLAWEHDEEDAAGAKRVSDDGGLVESSADE